MKTSAQKSDLRRARAKRLLGRLATFERRNRRELRRHATKLAEAAS